jgi:uncharacterized protein YkuJ
MDGLEKRHHHFSDDGHVIAHCCFNLFAKNSSLLLAMASATSSVVFDDIFTINAIDKEGKKFDRGWL